MYDLEQVWVRYNWNFFFIILIASMCFQIPLICDDYKRVIKCQYVLQRWYCCFLISAYSDLKVYSPLSDCNCN